MNLSKKQKTALIAVAIAAILCLIGAVIAVILTMRDPGVETGNDEHPAIQFADPTQGAIAGYLVDQETVAFDEDARITAGMIASADILFQDAETFEDVPADVKIYPDGYFTAVLPEGNYTVTVQSPGYQPYTLPDPVQVQPKKVHEIKEPIRMKTVLPPEEAVNIFMDHKGQWMYASDHSPMNGYSYLFLDLDFDGTLELILNVNDGSGRYSTNTYYKIDEEKRTVTKIRTDSEDENYFDEYQYDYSLSEEYPKLLRSRGDRHYEYYCMDHLRVNNSEHSYYYGSLLLKDGLVTSDFLFAEHLHPSGNGSDESATDYSVFENGSWVTVSEEIYREKSDAYFARFEDLQLTHGSVSGRTFESAAPEEQYALMLEAYEAFGYKGFAFRPADKPEKPTENTTENTTESTTAGTTSNPTESTTKEEAPQNPADGPALILKGSENIRLAYTDADALYYLQDTGSTYRSLFRLELTTGDTKLADKDVVSTDLQYSDGYLYYTVSADGMYKNAFRRIGTAAGASAENVDAVNREISIKGSKIKNSYALVYKNNYYTGAWYNGNQYYYIYSFDASGNAKVLSDSMFPAADMRVYNDTLYFDGVNLNDDGIYSLPVNGGSYRTLYSGSACIICVQDEKIFFSTGTNTEGLKDLWVIPVGGGTPKKLLNSKHSEASVFGGWVYYIDEDDQHLLKRVNISTSAVQTLTQGTCEGFSVNGERSVLYYLSAYAEETQLFRIRLGDTVSYIDQEPSKPRVSNAELAGKYKTKDYPGVEMYTPAFTLYADGRYSFLINNLSEMKTVEGTYTFDGSLLTLTPDRSGEATVVFQLKSKNEFLFMNDFLGDSHYGDVFEKTQN